MDLRQLVRDVPDFPKPGILFRDLTPLMRDPEGWQEVIRQLAVVCERLQPDLIVGIEKLPSIGLESTAALDLRIQQALMTGVPEIAGVVARAGADEIGLDPMGLNKTDPFLGL